MKKKIFTLATALCVALGASAQLPAGSIAPNWTFTDLNGNTHTLYDYLDQGKTVFIEVSAAWCAPCWAFHNTHAFRDLYINHGPAGMSGVSSSTTNDVMVFFIEGEVGNTTAQLYGPAGGSGVTLTQGDWVTGTPFPIIDPSGSAITTFNTNYNINYFPTVYMVCRDRLIQEIGQKSAAELYAAASGTCPTYAPSTSTDAKAVAYTGKTYFTCTANPTVKFQNYGANTITSATVNMYSGTTLVASQAWTGSLAPYAVGSVTFTPFTPTAFAPYRYEVVVGGDTYAANNNSEDSLFVVYNASNTFPVPYTENFEWTTEYPDNLSFSGDDLFVTNGTSTTSLVQADGTTGSALIAYFYNSSSGSVSEMLLGNFNTASMTTPNLQFDVSYKQYIAENDKLEVQVSTDCGATWTSVYNKAGSALATGAPATSLFIPTSASMWRHETVDLNAYKNSNLFIKFKTTSNYGNNLFIDNINLSNSLAVANMEASNDISIYPNPANSQATLSLNLAEQANVTVSVVDVAGRVVYTSNNNLNAGANKVVIPTADLATGIYKVKVQSGTFSTVKQLSVVK